MIFIVVSPSEQPIVRSFDLVLVSTVQRRPNTDTHPLVVVWL